MVKDVPVSADQSLDAPKTEALSQNKLTRKQLIDAIEEVR